MLRDKIFGVRVDTAYRICSLRKYEVKRRSGSRGKKMDDTHVQFLLENIESRPDITFTEMKQSLSINKGIKGSVT